MPTQHFPQLTFPPHVDAESIFKHTFSFGIFVRRVRRLHRTPRSWIVNTFDIYLVIFPPIPLFLSLFFAHENPALIYYYDYYCACGVHVALGAPQHFACAAFVFSFVFFIAWPVCAACHCSFECTQTCSFHVSQRQSVYCGYVCRAPCAVRGKNVHDFGFIKIEEKSIKCRVLV